jgi:hypothetical protein
MRQQIISLGIIASLMVPWVQGRVRYMPFGDSITDYGCWRPWIEEKLKQEGLDVDFVGTRKAQAVCNNLPYDRDHEGHPGFHAHSIAKENQLVDWLRQNPADILTMHLSTVDIVLANRKIAEIIAAYSTLLDQMRAINPAMRIIVRFGKVGRRQLADCIIQVAQIIPIPSSAKAVQDLNKAIPAWASSKNTTASPI